MTFFFNYYIKYELVLTIGPNRPKAIHYKTDYLLKVDQTLWKTQTLLLPQYIYTKVETSCESAWGPATWHFNVAFNIFYLFSLSFFYCYPIDHSNLFLLSYKFNIFYLFFLLSIFYYYSMDHCNFFLLLYQIWVVLDN